MEVEVSVNTTILKLNITVLSSTLLTVGGQAINIVVSSSLYRDACAENKNITSKNVQWKDQDI